MSEKIFWMSATEKSNKSTESDSDKQTNSLSFLQLCEKLFLQFMTTGHYWDAEGKRRDRLPVGFLEFYHNALRTKPNG